MIAFIDFHKIEIRKNNQDLENPNIIIDHRAVAEENTEEKWLGEANI